MNAHTHERQRLRTCTDRGKCQNLAPGRSESGLCHMRWKKMPGPRNPVCHFFLSSYLRVAECGLFFCQGPTGKTNLPAQGLGPSMKSFTTRADARVREAQAMIVTANPANGRLAPRFLVVHARVMCCCPACVRLPHSALATAKYPGGGEAGSSLRIVSMSEALAGQASPSLDQTPCSGSMPGRSSGGGRSRVPSLRRLAIIWLSTCSKPRENRRVLTARGICKKQC